MDEAKRIAFEHYGFDENVGFCAKIADLAACQFLFMCWLAMYCENLNKKNHTKLIFFTYLLIPTSEKKLIDSSRSKTESNLILKKIMHPQILFIYWQKMR